MSTAPRHRRRPARLIRYGIPGGFIALLLASVSCLSAATLAITGVIR